MRMEVVSLQSEGAAPGGRRRWIVSVDREPPEGLARLPDPRLADAESRTAQNGISLARSPPEGGVQPSSRRLVSSAPPPFRRLSRKVSVPVWGVRWISGL